MKSLSFLILLTSFAFAAQAQNFSPSAAGTGNPSVAAPATTTTPFGSPALGSPIGNQGAGTILGSHSAAGGDIFNSNLPNATFGQSLDNPPGVGVPGSNLDTLDRTNTAPTSIPTDTTLLNTPSNDPIRQSQEEVLPSGSGSGVNAGSGVGTGSGTGTSQPIDSTSPVINP